MTSTLLFDNQSKDMQQSSEWRKTPVRNHISKKHKGKSAQATSSQELPTPIMMNLPNVNSVDEHRSHCPVF